MKSIDFVRKENSEGRSHLSSDILEVVESDDCHLAGGFIVLKELISALAQARAIFPGTCSAQRILHEEAELTT